MIILGPKSMQVVAAVTSLEIFKQVSIVLVVVASQGILDSKSRSTSVIIQSLCIYWWRSKALAVRNFT